MARTDRLPPELTTRFKALQDLPEGLIEHRISQFSQIAVARDGADIFMAFCPLDRPLTNENLSAVMARYDPADPLLLRGRYMQAMLAAHAFAPHPARIYLMGAGGGRLALVQRYLMDVPEVVGCELDFEVLALSRIHFGLQAARGVCIEAAEGRAHLAEQAEAQAKSQGAGQFDHVYVDCFSAQGRVPAQLVTPEAFETIRAAIAPGGVMAMNLLAADPRAGEILAAATRVFDAVWRWEEAGSQVLFGVTGTAMPRGLPPQAPDLGFDLGADIRRLIRVSPLPPG